MVKIRLQRVGAKKAPFYHIVVADSRSPRDGKIVEKIGTYDPMTEPSTLTDFINFSKKNYPADRYILVMWNHGAGSVNGYGYDENYTTSGSMSIDEIQSAIKKSKIKFDIIGFDAFKIVSSSTTPSKEAIFKLSTLKKNNLLSVSA